MKFLIIFGPPAVGKMTVGYELAKLTGMKVFHNHMTIDLVLEFFPFGHEKFHTLVGEFRRRIFEEVATSKLPGIIFTFVWALDIERERKQIDEYTEIFKRHYADIYYVELEADLEERLKRNKTEFRLSKKPSKRDVVRTEKRLLANEEKYQMNSINNFFYKKNYVKINNTDLSPKEAAQKIISAFGFTKDP